jgi:hypothetical protein
LKHEIVAFNSFPKGLERKEKLKMKKIATYKEIKSWPFNSLILTSSFFPSNLVLLQKYFGPFFIFEQKIRNPI